MILIHRLDRWLASGEAGGARRFAVFRVLFCLFYLWYESELYAEDLIYPGHPGNVLLPRLIDPPAFVLPAIEHLLVAALVLLMLGVRVRAMTGAVLVLGGVLGLYRANLDAEKATVFLIFHIPLAFCLFGRWDPVHEEDSEESSPLYVLPIRICLFLLGAYFLSSATEKIWNGSWISGSEVLPRAVIKSHALMALQGQAGCSVNALAGEPGLISELMMLGVIAFEGLFLPLVLYARTRRATLTAGLLFHSFNAICLGVTFTPIMVTYLLFVDWSGLHRRLAPHLPRVPLPLALGAAVLLAAMWNVRPGPRDVIRLWGWLNWQTLWGPIPVLALLWGIAPVLPLGRKGSDGERLE